MIRTSLGEEFRVTPAPLGARFAAFIVDQAAWWFMALLLAFVVAALGFRGLLTTVAAQVADAVFVAALTGFLVLWPAWLQHRDGATKGQRWAGLALLRENGDPPGFLDCVVLEALRPLDCATPLALLAVAGERRTLGERAAGLVLVRLDPTEEA